MPSHQRSWILVFLEAALEANLITASRSLPGRLRMAALAADSITAWKALPGRLLYSSRLDHGFPRPDDGLSTQHEIPVFFSYSPKHTINDSSESRISIRPNTNHVFFHFLKGFPQSPALLQPPCYTRFATPASYTRFAKLLWCHTCIKK